MRVSEAVGLDLGRDLDHDPRRDVGCDPRHHTRLRACTASPTPSPSTSSGLERTAWPRKPLKRKARKTLVAFLEPGSSLLPVKKRMARMWRAEKKRRRLERAPNFVVVRLCSGDPVGTDPKALRQLGGQAVMDVDVRPEDVMERARCCDKETQTGAAKEH